MSTLARNLDKGIVLVQRVALARSLAERTLGLLGRSGLAPEESLWLSPCPSIHTFFMRFPIDVVFLSAEDKILWCGTVPPWRFSPWVRGAKGALEMPAGKLKQTNTTVGDRIVFEEN